eukprot:9591015-Alexandrium_andersonii.AAC.1
MQKGPSAHETSGAGLHDAELPSLVLALHAREDATACAAVDSAVASQAAGLDRGSAGAAEDGAAATVTAAG